MGARIRRIDRTPGGVTIRGKKRGVKNRFGELADKKKKTVGMKKGKKVSKGGARSRYAN